MRLKATSVMCAGVFCWVAGVAAAEVMYSVKVPSLKASVLFDQIVNEPTLVTVKPAAQSVEVDAEQVTAQCLWSVNVSLAEAGTRYTPGKMICLGPNQEVLEALPVGDITPLGQCADATCSSLSISAGDMVTMTLTEPLVLTVQPRNERK